MITAVLWLAFCVATNGADAEKPPANVFYDFQADEDRQALMRVLRDVPGESAEMTYLGLINDAARRGEEMRAAVERLRQSKDDADGQHRDAANQQLVLALRLQLDAIERTSQALSHSFDDPIRLLIVIRATAILAESTPCRTDVEPLSIESARYLDNATLQLYLLLDRALRAGLKLRESVIGLEEAVPEIRAARSQREAARSLAEAALRVRDSRLERLGGELQKNAVIRDVRNWFERQANGGFGNSPRSDVVRCLLSQKETQKIKSDTTSSSRPSFAVADVYSLVPWPYVLAEIMGWGKIAIEWTMISFEPVDASRHEQVAPPQPAVGATGVQPRAKQDVEMVLPRLDIAAKFVFDDQTGRAIPIYMLKLAGPPVDRLTLGDEQKYRHKLSEHLLALPAFSHVDSVSTDDGGAVVTTNRAVFDISYNDALTLSEIRKRFQSSPYEGVLRAFDEQRDKQLKQGLGENEITYLLAGHTWGGTNLYRDLYWILRLPSLRAMHPHNSPERRFAPSAANLPPTRVEAQRDEYLTRLHVSSKLVNEADFNPAIAPIAELIRTRFSGAMRDAAAAGETADQDDRRALNEAEQALLDRKADYLGDIIPTRGTFDRLIQAEIDAELHSQTNWFYKQVPVWLPADEMFDVLHDEIAAAPRSQPAPVATAVARLLNAANRSLFDCGAVRRHAGWSQFVASLPNLEEAAKGLFGEAFLRQRARDDCALKRSRGDHGVSSLCHPSLAGYVTAQVSRGIKGRVAEAKEFPALKRQYAELQSRLDAAEDAMRFLDLGMAEIAWLQETLSLCHDEVWQAYVEECREPRRKHDAEPGFVPPLPEPFCRDDVTRCRGQKERLTVAVGNRLKKLDDSHSQLHGLIETFSHDFHAAFRARYPDRDGAIRDAPHRNSFTPLILSIREHALQEHVIRIADDLTSWHKESDRPPDRRRVEFYRHPFSPGTVHNRPIRSWAFYCSDVFSTNHGIAERASQKAKEWRDAWKGASVLPVSDADTPEAVRSTAERGALAGVLRWVVRLEEAGVPEPCARNGAFSMQLAHEFPWDAAEAIRRELRLHCAKSGVAINPSLSTTISPFRAPWIADGNHEPKPNSIRSSWQD